VFKKGTLGDLRDQVAALGLQTTSYEQITCMQYRKRNSHVSFNDATDFGLWVQVENLWTKLQKNHRSI